MRITPIAAASIIPATVAGVALTIMPFATGVPAAAASRPHPRAVHTSHPRTAPQRARVTATAGGTHPAAAPQPGAAPQQPPAPQPPAPQMSAAETAFESCVAWRESGNNPTASSAGLFGILPATWAQLGFPGTAGQSSVALQKIAFDRLYKQLGTQPWAPYDGC